MYEFEIKDMTCGHCVIQVTRAITACDARAAVRVDLPNQKVSVKSAATEAALREKLAGAGYPAS